MDRLEQYLDQVCRGLGGPRALRQHVRQELREHLLDAAAAHKASGLTEEQAFARALEDFGGTEQVRSELEATHGYRLMPLVIDKAIEWKERTMRAKWLWTTWAYLALVVVILLNVLWITFANIFLVPRFEKLLHDGLIDPRVLDEAQASWMVSFLRDIHAATGQPLLWLLLAAGAWALLEWRVRSENKPFIRLSALGSAAVALTLLGILVGAALVIPYQVGAPAAARMVRPFALGQISTINASVSEMEQALPKKDWPVLQQQALRAAEAASRLNNTQLVATSLGGRQQATAVEQLRDELTSANAWLLEAQQASRGKNYDRLELALFNFRKHFGTVSAAAERAEK
jgi:hypothetical protein